MNKYPLPDFDVAFGDYAEKWFHAHKNDFANPEAMEEALPEVYLRWLNEPCKALGGTAPGLYYESFSDPAYLVGWIEAYLASGVSLPDPLLERLTSLEGADEAIYAALPEAPGEDECEKSMLFLNLLSEMASDLPLARCIAWIARSRAEGDELADAAVEAISHLENGERVVNDVLAAYDSAASDAAKSCFLDVLANYPGDKRVYKKLEEALLKANDKTFFALLLAKYGDTDAIELLRRVALLPEVSYVEFCEMRAAVEALGGEWGIEREFSGDRDYEKIRSLE